MLGVVQNLDRFEPMSVKIWNKEVGDGIKIVAGYIYPNKNDDFVLNILYYNKE